MRKHIEVFVLDVLALCALFPEVHEFGALSRALDRLEELTACSGCFRNKVRRTTIFNGVVRPKK
ncbi:hypothetical protein [Haladaptatus halobius]|uniref:hypothetical protein n=1 Tax=Haladaptatus halobius TaxID=2884875 RepID=UPI001D0B6066|nr:hypothetical protein [Haladaptatus halobius]